MAIEYEVTTGSPIAEHEALEQVAAMGFYGLAFDEVQNLVGTRHGPAVVQSVWSGVR